MMLSILGNLLNAQTLSKEQIKAIEKVITEEKNIAGVPGVAVGIIYDNQVVFEKGFGLTNNQTKIAMTDSTIFQVASVTKTFTALTILKELKDVNIGVHEPVGEVIKGLSPVVSSITFHQLLTHTGGLIDYTNYNDKTDIFEFFKDIGDSILFIEPGKVFSYSNTGYALLDLAIEQLSGMTYPEAVTKDVIKPLKLHNTGFDLYEVAAKSFSAGHVLRRKLLVPEMYQCEKPLVRAAGGIFSNIQDLERLALCLMNDGIFEGLQVFDPEIIEQMCQPYAREFQASASSYFGPANAPNSAYGRGVWMFDYGNQRIIATAGGGTQLTFLLYAPDANFSLILASNHSSEILFDSFNKIIEIVLEEKIPSSNDFKSNEEERNDIIGRYCKPEIRTKELKYIEILEKNETLYINFNGTGDIELEQIGQLTYRFSFPNSRLPMAMNFQRDESNKVAYLKYYWRTWLKTE